MSPLGHTSELLCLQCIYPDSSDYDRNVSRYVGCLIGWHEAYLNSALFAYEANNVIDWIDFFSDDWSSALRFDRFPTLAALLHQSLYSDKGVISVLDKVLEAAEATDDLEVIAQARRNVLGERGSKIDTHTRNVILTNLMDFIRKHKSYLPAFYIPDNTAKTTAGTGGAGTKK
jgi:hypothetical protein